MTAPTIRDGVLYARDLVAFLRGGGLFETGGNVEDGRTARVTTQLRLAPSRIDGEIEFQIRVRTVSRKGRETLLAWTRCDWTLAGLASLRLDVEDLSNGGFVTAFGPAEPGDPVTDAIENLARTGRTTISCYAYALTDEGIVWINAGGTAQDLVDYLHGADGWIVEHLADGQKIAIVSAAPGSDGPVIDVEADLPPSVPFD